MASAGNCQGKYYNKLPLLGCTCAIVEVVILSESMLCVKVSLRFSKANCGRPPIPIPMTMSSTDECVDERSLPPAVLPNIGWMDGLAFISIDNFTLQSFVDCSVQY